MSENLNGSYENGVPNDRNDKLPDKGIIIRDTKLKKLDNFWYYHKWKVIIILAAAIVSLVFILQACESDKIDGYIMYSGPYQMFSAEEYNPMKSAFEAVLPYDYNGDGKKVVQIINTYVLSEEQIQSMRAVTDEDGSRVYQPDVSYIKGELDRFDSLILAGEYSVCILDPYLYERVKSANGFVELSTLFDEVPDTAIDDYGIRFSETEFAKYFDALDCLPVDSILCLRRQSTVGFGGDKANGKAYEFSVAFFKSIVNYIPD